MEAQLTVCRLQKEHLAAVAEIERLCFSQPWSEKALELLLGESGVGFVCLAEDEVTAYGGMMLDPWEGQITNIATHPAHRRRGYGNAVTDALLKEAAARNAEQVSLEVRASNASAIALYERLGFAIAGRRKGFYQNPREDALVMIKTFGKEGEA
jgi:ribosomal-protein-alanine N-acetyltransferase